jgi:hypothetical protein
LGCKLDTRNNSDISSEDVNFRADDSAAKLAQLEITHLALRERYNEIFNALQLSQFKIIERDLSHIETVQKIVGERDLLVKKLAFASGCNERLTTLNLKLNVANRRLLAEKSPRNSFIKTNLTTSSEVEEHEDVNSLNIIDNLRLKN